ncbi:pentapeptide repeat-containing protein [Peptostreptococcus canis]|uniref:Pentapeptide repeat-containing protein n=1 Tax=Peptostreptococcus canis TaxID=1159213 RepID=A0ABR6TM12_9FIRM|nr:pentapeptide repeat-containing protein [Peptostreptococcus canis]MBC2576355.1 pentapeptide repeat-containing protein [Peptostreptococcus canis]MBP1998554.1 hypothetical protein [Peptostreptococcus canis]
MNRDELINKINLLRQDKIDSWSAKDTGIRFKNSTSRNIVLEKISISNVDLSGLDLSFIDFSWSEFINVDFSKCNFKNSKLDHSKCSMCTFRGAVLVDASLFSVDFRGCDLSDTECDGADFTASLLRDANLENLHHTDRTIHFKMSCPEEGYFFGYKKCFNDRMVKLLIPKDARRSSGTTNACRCDKAKTVAITNLDGTGSYTEANSFVDGEFVYKLGEMSYADSFNPDRWLESSNGIHFWMSFEEALAYM